MDKNKFNIYKEKLLKEKDKIKLIIDNLEKNDFGSINIEMASEISHYDNHPADAAGDVYDMERGMALKRKEEVLLEQVENSLKSLEQGSYGTCKSCGEEISEERLSFIPYAEYCIDCQKLISSIGDQEKRPVEEQVIGTPFYYEHLSKDYTGFDEKDSYQAVEKFNSIEDLEYSGDDDMMYVEPIEKISNEQYKAGLPD